MVTLSTARFDRWPLHLGASWATGTWSDWALAQADEVDPDSLARAGLRSKSLVIEAALAYRCAGLTWGVERLRDAAAAGDHFPVRDVRAAASLALLWAGLSTSPTLMAAAANLYTRLVEQLGANKLSKEHQQAAAQALFLARRFTDAAQAVRTFGKLPSAVVDYLKADLASPAAIGSEPSRLWLELLSVRHTAANLEPLRLVEPMPDGCELFDALDCCSHGEAGGELVSVIVPCYQPDRGLITSLRSLLAQTWRDIEVVVVDDGSGAEYDEWLDLAECMDPRIRVFRLESNGGAYRARNVGINVARGSILTFQDADDWSHPRRIELQVGRLNEDSALATRSTAVRARPDLTHQWFGYSPLRVNASSLMLRRDALEKFGPFIELRKGSDSEYEARIIATGATIANLPEPLAVTRLRPGSLSRGDFTYQWAAPDRLDFRGNYAAWHRTLDRTDDLRQVDPRVPPFAVPTRFVSSGRRQLDVVFAADYSEESRTAGAVPRIDDIDRLARNGVRQGLWHLEDIRFVRRDRPTMDDAWRDAIQSRDLVESVCRTDEVDIEHLIVCNPAILLTRDSQETYVDARTVEIWLSPEDLEPSMSGLPVDLLWVSDRCMQWWSTRPHWVAAPYLTPDERAELVELAGTLELGESRVRRL